MLELNEIQFAFELAITAYIFCCILIDTDGLFEFYGDFLLEIKQKNKFFKYITKPLGLCEKCFAGQIALWSWLVLNFSNYNAMKHIIFVATTIFLTFLIKVTINKWKT